MKKIILIGLLIIGIVSISGCVLQKWGIPEKDLPELRPMGDKTEEVIKEKEPEQEKEDNLEELKTEPVNCLPLKIHGDAKNKLNIIFVPDGYSQSELNLFKQDVDKFIEPKYNFGPFAKSPFEENLQKINFYRIDSPLNDLASFEMDENKSFNYNKIKQVIQYCFDDNPYLIDYQVFILGNKEQFHSSYAFAATAPRRSPGYVALFTRVNGKEPYKVYNALKETTVSYTAIHEFGHAFGNLADEFRNTKPISRIDRVNCDTIGCPKWCEDTINEDIACYQKVKKHLDCLKNKPSSENEGYCWNIIRDQCLLENDQDKFFCNNMLEEEYEEVYNCNIGKNCETGTGCYFNCRGTNGYRSSITSIMKQDGKTDEFNIISKEHLIKLLEKYKSE